MRKVLEVGGILAAIVLIAFGIGAIITGVNGKNTVSDNLTQERIVGSPDMTPDEIKKSAAEANLPSDIELPTCTVAGKTVDNGDNARCFAAYMRIHALETTGGKTYAELPRFSTADGKGTDDEQAALKNDKGRPVDNPIRSLWINETALSTALNTAYMAERISVFGIVTGIAMLLTGIGLGLLSLAVFGMGGAKRRDEEAGAPPATT